jgi:FkbM family methyltransferase
MITYAQNFEDVMLARVFPDRAWGFYVDVGAGDPEHLSVTKWFYDLGWSGINVEPNSTLHAKLVAARPRDTNLDCAAGAAPGSAPFFQAEIAEFSTLDCASAKQSEFAGVTRTIQVLPLTTILERYGAGRQIDFLKIDVEGWEPAVLSGLDLQRYRPTIIVVEATVPHTRTETAFRWEQILIEAGYLDVYFDGLNKFYLAKEKADLRTHFLLPPNVFDAIVDGRALSESQRLQITIAEKDREIATLESFKLQLGLTKDDLIRLEKKVDELTQGAKGELDRLEKRAKGELDRLEQRMDALTEGTKGELDRLEKRMEKLIRPVREAAERLEKSSEALTHILTRPSLMRRMFQRITLPQRIWRRAMRDFRPSLMRRMFQRITLPRRIWRRAMRDFRPILFTPRQYRPRPLRLPASYGREIAPSDAPSITIVTPSFNQGRFIGATIDSVLSQNYPNLRYIVQDGKSADDTVDLLRRYGSRIEWASETDRGQAHAINRGFARSLDTELMAYLNSDDILLPGTIAYVANTFARHPELDLAYGHRIFIDDQGREIGRCVLPEHDPETLLWADYVPQETLFWRRRVWRAVGPLDETFSYALDWDFILRAQKAEFKLRRLPRFLAGFRVHKGQKTWGWMELGEQEMERLRQRNFGRKVTTTEINRNIKRYLSRHIAINLKWRYGFIRF